METEVIYQNGFQEQYFLADSKDKIEIILGADSLETAKTDKDGFMEAPEGEIPLSNLE